MDDIATMTSETISVPSMSTGIELYVTMTSSGEVSSAFAVGVVVPAEMRSTSADTSTMALQAIVAVIMSSLTTGTTSTPSAEDGHEVWVVNLDRMGSTRYENYPFNSFAKIGGRYYGAKQDGIYQLDGEDDAGDPVQAMLSFGKQTFGTSAQKTVPNCYVGMSAGGQMFLKVLYEGKDYIYAARATSDEMKVQRFDLGKGIKANYLEFELYNKDGSDFDLDTVEFNVATLSRRI